MRSRKGDSSLNADIKKSTKHCYACNDRTQLEKYFRDYFARDINNSASRLYVFAIPRVEELLHARCGEWVTASNDALGQICFNDHKTVRQGLELLKLKGLIEYKPGTGWGVEHTTHIRRKTIEEIKLLAGRRAQEIHRIHRIKKRGPRPSIDLTDGYAQAPRLADRLKGMLKAQ